MLRVEIILLLVAPIVFAATREQKVLTQYHKDVAKVKKAEAAMMEHMRPYVEDCTKGLILGQPGQIRPDRFGDPVCTPLPPNSPQQKPQLAPEKEATKEK